MKRSVVFLGTTIIALIAAVIGCDVSARTSVGSAEAKAATASPGEPAVRVVAAVPARKTLRRVTTQPGQIQAFEQTPLFAKLPAYVKELHVDIGDTAKQDQPLVDLWIPELEAEGRQKEALVTQAKAGVAQATVAVHAAEASTRTAEAAVREARAGTIRTRGTYERWKSEHRRIEELAASHSIDPKLVDETREQLSAADAAREEAEAKIAFSEATVAERHLAVEKAQADLITARANVASAEADLARVNALLQYRQIRMPYAGIVVERNVNRGDFVQAANTTSATPLLVVARNDLVRVFVDVPEMEAGLIQPGAKGTIAVQAIPNRTIEATVTRTSWALGSNRTLRTELDVPNPAGVLRPGMYANAEIVLQERANAISLPAFAITTVEQQMFCYCVVNERLVRKPISVGLRTAQDVEVTDGLTGQETVVQSPVAALREGQLVEVTRPGA